MLTFVFHIRIYFMQLLYKISLMSMHVKGVVLGSMILITRMMSMGRELMSINTMLFLVFQLTISLS